jgi:hypothetical protein
MPHPLVPRAYFARLSLVGVFALAAGSTPAPAQGFQRYFERPTTFGSEPGGAWSLTGNPGAALPDLIFIKTSGTPNGHVEVHVAPGATQYQSRGLEIATTFLNESDGVWGLVSSGSGTLPDLYFIKTRNTPSGRVEVHIASAASNYQARTVETATTFANEDNGVWSLVSSAAGGAPDLVYVKTRNTPNNRVEVHIASGASRYQSRTLEIATTFAAESNGTWGVVANPAGGFPDLYFIKTLNTPSGRVEVHTASGSSRYQARTLEVVTDFLNENNGAWSLIPGPPGNPVPALAYIKTRSTPNGLVEVHLARYGTR